MIKNAKMPIKTHICPSQYSCIGQHSSNLTGSCPVLPALYPTLPYLIYEWIYGYESARALLFHCCNSQEIRIIIYQDIIYHNMSV